MASEPAHLVTQLLDAVGQGDPAARDRLFEVMYHELHRMARMQMADEPAVMTLQPTALVHEAYVRLFCGNNGHYENRRHFFGAAARAMRRILIDEARKRQRQKRGGRATTPKHRNVEPHIHDTEETRSADAVSPSRNRRDRLPLTADALFTDPNPADVLDLDSALSKLQEFDALLAEIVQLRFFAGLTIEQASQVIGVSPRTVNTQWRAARAWLHRALSCD